MTKTMLEYASIKKISCLVLEGYPKEKVGSQDYLAATIALKEAGYNEVEVSEKTA